MTDEEQVLVSEGNCADRFHVPLGATNFPRCGRNAQNDVDFERVDRGEAEKEYDQCQRCPFDAAEKSDEKRLIADGGYAKPPEVTVYGDSEDIVIGIEHGDISIVVQAPPYLDERELEKTLDAADQELHHLLSVLPRSRVSSAPSARSTLPARADGGDDA